MRAFRRYCRLLRTALLVLLVLGMVVSPVLAAVGELHAMEHAAVTASDGAHDHAHAADSDHHDHHGDPVDPDHATGGHGLMHQAGSVSVTLPDAAFTISMQSSSEPLLPGFGRSHLPGDSPSLPFRPPIA